ncbi:MAG: ASCH domain-containing protein [Caldilinea sp.]
MTTTVVEQFWQAYLATLPDNAPARLSPYVAEGFGDNAELADELGALVLEGKKTATCSALWEWEAEAKPVTEVGSFWIVLDGRGAPMCIVETVEVAFRRYDEVDAAFAYEEGEDDRSLQSWRDAHRRFFTRTLAVIGKEFTTDMPLVCERFRVVYRGKE